VKTRTVLLILVLVIRKKSLW